MREGKRPQFAGHSRLMRILRASNHRQMPWKNGGGVTTEIAVAPPGASVGNFDWRISMATVAADGPFSRFDGIDRTLTVLSGEGLELTVEDETPVRLTPAGKPHPFPGDVAASAKLIAGPVTDFNVMTRWGRWTLQRRQSVHRWDTASARRGRCLHHLLPQWPDHPW